MIKFFRNIRQQLLKENKLTKYLLYAIGEIVLVVIGILIALNINNWNEYKKDRVLEKKVLENLVENLENNKNLLERRIRHINGAMYSGEVVLKVFEEGKTYPDSLKFYIHHAVRQTGHISLSKIGYDFFKEAGFGIIENDTLSRQITMLFEEDFVHFHRSLEWEERGQVEKERFMDHHFVIRKGGRDGTPLNVAFNGDELLKSNYFKALLYKIHSQRGFFKFKMSNHIEYCDELLLAINEELAKLNGEN